LFRAEIEPVLFGESDIDTRWLTSLAAITGQPSRQAGTQGTTTAEVARY